jgi:hypothetical protein
MLRNNTGQLRLSKLISCVQYSVLRRSNWITRVTATGIPKQVIFLYIYQCTVEGYTSVNVHISTFLCMSYVFVFTIFFNNYTYFVLSLRFQVVWGLDWRVYSILNIKNWSYAPICDLLKEAFSISVYIRLYCSKFLNRWTERYVEQSGLCLTWDIIPEVCLERYRKFRTIIRVTGTSPLQSRNKV